MINKWVSTRHAVASWLIEFPEFSGDDVSNLVEFMRQLLALAEQESLFRIIKVESPFTRMPDFVAGQGFSYPDFMLKVFQETGVLGLLAEVIGYGRGIEKDEVQIPSRVCYYNQDGVIVEEEVNNLGQILHKLRTDVEYPDWLCMAPALPLSINGNLILPESTGHHRTPYLFIRIYTDIWLPRVRGLMEEVMPLKGATFDNRELANRHTPRLNRFLVDARELTIKHGGSWKFEKEEVHVDYRDMITETGILLDA